MALTESDLQGRLAPILDEVARQMSLHGVKTGAPSSAPGEMRVVLEENVKRVVQVYWTPFQAEIPGRSVGLHLEIDKPKLHWVEAYISPSKWSWIFSFHERADGDVQLAYYQQHEHPKEAVTAFFDIAAWYALTPTDLTWPQMVATTGEGITWTEGQAAQAAAGEELDKAVQEAIKKSTILWLRWDDAAGTSRTMPVWFVTDQGKIYVLSGEREQTIPGARDLRNVDVIMRWKGKNAQVADLAATVRVVPPGPEWDTLAEKIADKRLNIPGVPEDTARRWRDECDILELTIR
ncbi:MAG: hypothetical protein ACR2L3_00555 [Actinomycetota bacterium]